MSSGTASLSSLSESRPITNTVSREPLASGSRVLKSDSGLLPLYTFDPAPPSNVNAREAEHWKEFLQAQVEGDLNLARAVHAARSIWNAIESRYLRARLPVTSVTDDGEIRLAWRSRSGTYIEIETAHGGGYTWLFRDSRNDVTRHGGPSLSPPQEFWTYLGKHFSG